MKKTKNYKLYFKRRVIAGLITLLITVVIPIYFNNKIFPKVTSQDQEEELKKEHRIFMALAMDNYLKGDFVSSIDNYKKASEIMDNDVNIYLNISRIYLDDLKNYQNAILYSNKVIESKYSNDTQKKDAYLFRARSFSLLNNLSESINDFKKALAFDPHDPFINITLSYSHINLKDYMKAIEYADITITFYQKNLQSSTSRNNNLALAHYYKGISLRSLGRFDESIKSFEESYKFSDDPIQYFENMGLSYAMSTRYENAIEYFQKIVDYIYKINFNDPLLSHKYEFHNVLSTAYKNIGLAYYYLNDYEKSKEYYDISQNFGYKKNDFDMKIYNELLSRIEKK